jgi:serine/threonine protein phosphatase PrpC
VTLLRSGSATDVGRVRPVNEDRLLETGTLFAVADGMGGHAGGEIASRTAVETLQEGFFELDRSTASLVQAVQRANQAVWQRSRQEPGLRGMGTTLTALALVSDGGDQLAVANVGDSRAYLFRNDRLTQLTHDHSLVEEMVRSGELSTADAASHPQRHVLTRALGVEPDVDVDVRHVPPLAGDRVLLCSDGLVNEVDEVEIAAALSRPDDPRQVAAELVRAARAHGGSDNITAVVIDVVDEASPASTSAPAATSAGSLEGLGATTGRTGGAGSGGRARMAGPDKEASRAVSTLDPPKDLGPHAVAARHRRLEKERAPAVSVAASPTRRLTLRVAVFVVLLLAILAVAAGAVWWYASSSYFVGLAGNRVVIYQGRVGGLLWFKPHLVERTPLTVSEVPPDRISDVRSGMGEPSLAAARHYVSNLEAERRALAATSPAAAPAGSPATSSSTSTTAPGGVG